MSITSNKSFVNFTEMYDFYFYENFLLKNSPNHFQCTTQMFTIFSILQIYFSNITLLLGTTCT